MLSHSRDASHPFKEADCYLKLQLEEKSPRMSKWQLQFRTGLSSISLRISVEWRAELQKLYCSMNAKRTKYSINQVLHKAREGKKIK